MASFFINTRAEMLKCRKTAAYWLTIIAGTIVPIISWIVLVANPDEMLKEFETDAWRNLMNLNWQPAAAFFLPMYVVLVTSLVVQIEYRNNAWKQVYASPRSYADIFFSKFVIIHLLVLASLLFFNVTIILTGLAASAVNNGYKFSGTPIPWYDMLLVTSKIYISVLAMTAIQYWISLRLRNYIAPVGIGLALLITAVMIIQWKKIVYYPYAYTALTYFRNLNKGGMNHLTYSFIWFAGILALGFLDTVKRKERG
ncbi:ABC transporter permease [Paraflavitalea pollutisoli]|uniref:ABC transporter permease n=1 Tax=Paraflavitalea pollutisoli TaxID=3034143 RepID=UPI0023EB2ACB|nr:ABC transporter permease [Paraflavitalea sp. H1-2-19X]